MEALQSPSSSPTPGDSWATPEALRPLSSPRTLEFLPARFSCLSPDLPVCTYLSPWRPRAPASLAAAEGAFPVSPPSSISSPCSCSAPLSWVPHAVAIQVSLSHSAPPCGRCLLLCHQSLRFLQVPAAPLRALIVAPLLVAPPRVVLSPFVITAYLVPVILAPFSVRLLRCRPPGGRRPFPSLLLAVRSPCSVPVPPPLSGVSPLAVPRALAATHSTPRAPSPVPGGRYCL